ncbi:MAG TPA: DUF4245 domain-containing protein [Propionibacteriaceae bacterium]|nr:DUF4245 domain-containing protein [Propionibacteriaceae bacterium]
MARPSLSSSRPRDMVISLGVLLVPVLLITWWFTRTPADAPVQTVDWRSVLAQSRTVAPYPLLGPVGLPDTWVATKAEYARTGEPAVNRDPAPGNTWQLGMLSPDKVYVSLTQRDAAGPALVAQMSRSGRQDGTSTVNGVTWSRWVSADDRTRTLSRTDGSVTTVISGDLSYAGLEAFASTLRSS